MAIVLMLAEYLFEQCSILKSVVDIGFEFESTPPMLYCQCFRI